MNGTIYTTDIFYNNFSSSFEFSRFIGKFVRKWYTAFGSFDNMTQFIDLRGFRITSPKTFTVPFTRIDNKGVVYQGVYELDQLSFIGNLAELGSWELFPLFMEFLKEELKVIEIAGYTQYALDTGEDIKSLTVCADHLPDFNYDSLNNVKNEPVNYYCNNEFIAR